MSTSMPQINLTSHSISCIQNHQEENGAYHASPEFIAYKGYCWLRDGSFIAHAMSTNGEVSSANKFFQWCSDTILKNEDLFLSILDDSYRGVQTPAESMPPTRFSFNGDIQNDGWENFQLDGYGTWVWAALRHVKTHNLDLTAWAKALSLTTRYIANCWDRTCYDWWEEHLEQQHVSTLGCIAAGLREALAAGFLCDSDKAVAQSAYDEIMTRILNEGTSEGHLVKWIGSNRVDGSLSALVSPLEVIDPRSDLARNTLAAIDAELCFDNGVHRFLDDKFYGGGQWPLLSCFLGLGYIATGNRKRAEELLEWSASTANTNLDLPEQVGWHLLDQAHRPYWLKRWGPVATPLLWSHALYLLLRTAIMMEHK